MKIKFEATCNIPDDIENIENYIQREFDIHLGKVGDLNNLIVISAVEEKEPEPRKDIINGEPCPICGFNGEMKILNLTDEYVEVYCPQCHNKVKINVFDENN